MTWTAHSAAYKKKNKKDKRFISIKSGQPTLQNKQTNKNKQPKKNLIN